jgi:predicted AlkP superfamily pyrophosphatase or phosphodiesterase
MRTDLRPTAFLLIDGLSAAAAREMPTLAARQAAGTHRSFTVLAARPTLSLPNYATLITGQDPEEHGHVFNWDRSPLPPGHLFDEVRAAGGSVVLSAFDWWRDIAGASIDDGFFYEDEATDDALVFDMALQLWRKSEPSLLIVHPMGVDYAGDYRGGGRSQAYRERVLEMDARIDAFAREWAELAPGGRLLLGADHGMGPLGHGGDSPEEREVLYEIAAAHAPVHLPMHQREVRGLLRELIGLPQHPA